MLEIKSDRSEYYMRRTVLSSVYRDKLDTCVKQDEENDTHKLGELQMGHDLEFNIGYVSDITGLQPICWKFPLKLFADTHL